MRLTKFLNLCLTAFFFSMIGSTNTGDNPNTIPIVTSEQMLANTADQNNMVKEAPVAAAIDGLIVQKTEKAINSQNLKVKKSEILDEVTGLTVNKNLAVMTGKSKVKKKMRPGEAALVYKSMNHIDIQSGNSPPIYAQVNESNNNMRSSTQRSEYPLIV